MKSPSAIFVLPRKSPPSESEKKEKPYHNSIFNEIKSNHLHLSNYNAKSLDWRNSLNNKLNSLSYINNSTLSDVGNKYFKNNDNNGVKKNVENLNSVVKQTDKIEDFGKKQANLLFSDSVIIRRVFEEWDSGSVIPQKLSQLNRSESICSTLATQDENLFQDNRKPKPKISLRKVEDTCEQQYNSNSKQRLCGGKNTSQWSNLFQLPQNNTKTSSAEIKKDLNNREIIFDEISSDRSEEVPKTDQWQPQTEESQYDLLLHDTKLHLPSSSTKTLLKDRPASSVPSRYHKPTREVKYADKIIERRSKSTGNCKPIKNKLFHALNGYLRNKYQYQHSLSDLNNSHEFLYKISSTDTTKNIMQEILTDSYSQGSLYLPDSNIKPAFASRKTSTKLSAAMPFRSSLETQDSSNFAENLENECSVRVAVR